MEKNYYYVDIVEYVNTASPYQYHKSRCLSKDIVPVIRRYIS